MTDLTPLIARQKELRREILWSALGLLAIALGIVAFLGFTAKGGITMFFLFGGWTRMIRSRWRRQFTLFLTMAKGKEHS